jgi:hypothetical protein
MGLLVKAVIKQNSNAQLSVKPDVRVFIENYAKTSGSFHCIVVDSGVTGVDGMVSHLGSVLKLENGNSIILVPLSTDRHLLAHQISKNLSAGVLCQFAAQSASEAVENLAFFL